MEIPQYGDEIHIGVDAIDFDPEANPYSESSGSIGLISSLIYSTLFEFSGDTSLKKDLAASYTISDDQKTWDIELYSSIFFHDGSKLKADDVKNTFDFVKKNQENPFYDFLTSLEKVEILSQTRLRFTLKNYDIFFAYSLQFLPIIKRNQTIGTGAYKIDHYDEAKKILTLVPHNPSGKSHSYLKKVVIHFLPHYLDGLSMLTKQNLDFLYLADPTYEKLFAHHPNYRIILQKNPIYYVVDFNTQKNHFFQNQSLRQKMAAIIRNQPLPNQEIPLPTSIDIISYQEHEFNHTILYEMLQLFYARGTTLNPHLYPLAEFLKKMTKQDYDLALYPANLSFADYYIYQFAKNVGKKSLFNQGKINILDDMRYALHKKDREQALTKVYKIIDDSAPFIIFHQRHTPIVIHKRFRGYNKKPIEIFDEIEKMWVPQEEWKYP